MAKLANQEVKRVTAGWVPVEEALSSIIHALSDGPYLLGEHFSAADILYGTTFAMFAQNPMLPNSSLIDDYAKRVIARPAHARAQLKD